MFLLFCRKFHYNFFYLILGWYLLLKHVFNWNGKAIEVMLMVLIHWLKLLEQFVTYNGCSINQLIRHPIDYQSTAYSIGISNDKPKTQIDH